MAGECEGTVCVGLRGTTYFLCVQVHTDSHKVHISKVAFDLFMYFIYVIMCTRHLGRVPTIPF